MMKNNELDFCRFKGTVGHTELTLSSNPALVECVVIVEKLDQAELFRRKYDLPKTCRFISLGNLHKLRGLTLPIIFDNAAIFSLFSDVLRENSEKMKTLLDLYNKLENKII